MSTSTSVIISNKDDAHIPYVTRHMSNEPLLIDSRAVIAGDELSYSFSEKQLRVHYKGIDISHTTSVWLRRPPEPTEWNLPVASNYKDYSESALSETLNGLYVAFPEATWLSDHYAILRAENKQVQQVIASKLGFAVPDTIYTSSAAKAKQFITDHKVVAAKTLAIKFATDDEGRRLAFFTRKVTADDPIDFRGLSLAPIMLQTMLDVEWEARVTVVDDTVFTAKVQLSGQTNAKVRDWRIGHFEGNVAFEKYQLPVAMEQKCIKLVKRLGLHFGAIDLICDKNGIIWFLEINPNGQWAFVEKTTGQPIGKAIAAFLER